LVPSRVVHSHRPFLILLRTVLILCFFSLSPPPLLSPLFPYTTLFRSSSSGSVSDFSFISSTAAVTAACRRALIPAKQKTFCERLDRKSTRLNSSHEWISYAVFCLKKKKNYEVNTT